jgi:hypothetical protein
MITRRLIVIFALGITLIGLAIFGYGQWQRANRAGAEARYSNETRQAGEASAKDAIETTGAINAAQRETQAQVERSIDEIRNAPAGNSNDAATRAACKLRSYRNTRRCVELLGPPS